MVSRTISKHRIAQFGCILCWEPKKVRHIYVHTMQTILTEDVTIYPVFMKLGMLFFSDGIEGFIVQICPAIWHPPGSHTKFWHRGNNNDASEGWYQGDTNTPRTDCITVVVKSYVHADGGDKENWEYRLHTFYQEEQWHEIDMCWLLTWQYDDVDSDFTVLYFFIIPRCKHDTWMKQTNLEFAIIVHDTMEW